jgi:hypothetical protein
MAGSPAPVARFIRAITRGILNRNLARPSPTQLQSDGIERPLRRSNRSHADHRIDLDRRYEGMVREKETEKTISQDKEAH